MDLLTKCAVHKEKNVEKQRRNDCHNRDPDWNRGLRSQRRNKPFAFSRIGDLKTVRYIEHLGVDPWEDLVDGDHDHDGQGQAEISKESSHLKN